MRLRAAALIVFSLVCSQPVHAQDAERLALAREYVSVNRIDTLLGQTTVILMRPLMQQLLAKEQALTEEIRVEFLTRFEKQFLARTPEIAEAFAGHIAQEFTADELKQAIAFLKSPVGQRMLDFQPEMMKRGSEIGRVWGEKAGREAMEEVIQQMRAEGKLKTL